MVHFVVKQSMDDPAKNLRANFYRTASGHEPVREWLLEQSSEDRKIIGLDIKTVEFGWPIGMPTCRSLGRGIWEVRSNISGGRIARVFFAVQGDRMFLLHAFVKKTQKTPTADLALAHHRWKEMNK